MSSDEDAANLMASFKIGAPKSKRQMPPAQKQHSLSPGMFFSESSAEESIPKQNVANAARKLVAVRIPPAMNKNGFVYYEPKEEVAKVVREHSRTGDLVYEVQLLGGSQRQLTFDELLNTEGGSAALQVFQGDGTSSKDNASNSTSPAPNMRPGQRIKTHKRIEEGFVDSSTIDFSDDEFAMSSRKGRQNNFRGNRRATRMNHSRTRFSNSETSEEDTDSETPRRQRRRRKPPQEPVRRSGRSRAVLHNSSEEDEGEDEDEDSDELDILRSDIVFGGRKRKRKPGRPSASDQNFRTFSKPLREGTRQSDRSTRARNNMQEANVNDIYRSDSEPGPTKPAAKVVSVREVFETLPRSNLFRSRHVEGCEVCSEGPTLAPLIYCQGCSLSYHKNCLGNRSSRDHLVTKVGDENFVLQCKRCINSYKRKDSIAPDLAKCQDCGHAGPACKPFRARKTPLQEQKDREENGGQDPIVQVGPHLLNNASNVLFRCTQCSRAYHYHHLPPLSQYSMSIDRDEEEMADERIQEYSREWLCKDCHDTKSLKVSTLIAWRPSDLETYRPGTPCEMISEDDKQYLIKWENQSYFRASWHSGAWTWGVTSATMRKAYFKREGGPKMRTEDAVPEEYLRIDIVLDVKYTSYVEIQSEEIDKARIKEVDTALIKYKGLGYEDAVWEKVPTADDGDRWLDFVSAYNDWVAGRYIRYPKQGPLKARLDKARGTAFAKLEKQKQPENLVGGELMKYQIEGLNWIYYQWYSQKNGILADEMGLGKTIQVIGFMAALIEEHSCFPFLVVVPNSTCANWRREIKQWVPSLRVVTFFGSSTARDMAYKYELYPLGSKELRAHIVVTSYEAAADDSTRRFFRSVNWAALIVDEGQRLKNDKSILYNALTAVKAPFRLLLTGTPLQNNARELFNLLQFLDDKINAAELEEKYADMTSENIKELHDQIRPYILRRTKAQVLTFLPPLGQIIVPVSMSPLQKNLYKSILAKNPELLKALFTTQKTLKQQERANLSNILMQLRKCLCHPFVYSREIEERTDIAAVSHRNLVEASAKLQLLELLLPKLRERGHRVLIFSQFLDMLSIVEDFLDGMEMAYQRLDGTMGSLEKQKRIDQFNAPESPLFAFLLSTRAGGVGINLATADTVIILDPDFNPHQDIQAISRAHRIGQKKKVLCFQLMTRASAEEKIVQMGRKKMALDHVVVEQLDAEDIEDKDVESILRHGAAELFKDNTDHDVRYDEGSIDRLLDRSQIENTKTNVDDSAESQFSFARVWANDQGALADTIDTADQEEAAPDPGVWDKILKERQLAAAAEAQARSDALGRGRRARMVVDYKADEHEPGSVDLPSEATPVKGEKPLDKRKKKKAPSSESDTDFQVSASEDEDNSADEETAAQDGVDDLRDSAPQPTKGLAGPSPGGFKIKKPKANGAGEQHFSIPGPSVLMQRTSSPVSRALVNTAPSPIASAKGVNIYMEEDAEYDQIKASGRSLIAGLPSYNSIQLSTANISAVVKSFVRAQLPIRSPLDPTYGHHNYQICFACHTEHPPGACPLKVAGVEHCGLCGLAHFGYARTCPHIRSETQVRDMLQALKNSPEKKEHVEAAVKYLRGVKGALVQQKKKDRERAMMQAQGIPSIHGQYHDVPPGPLLHVPPAPGFPPGQNQGQPHPPPYGASGNVAPGSVGDYLSNQYGVPHQQQQRTPQPPHMEDHAVESALRGFLGR